MAKTIKAIETKYRGHRFRSRLEAKWAVFFDDMRIEWRYEPEGFVMKNGVCYLPDFFLPAFDMYVEVKPAVISFEEAEKIARFSFESEKNLLLIIDYPLKETMTLMRAETWGGPLGYMDPQTQDEEEAVRLWREREVQENRVSFAISPITHNWSLVLVKDPCADWVLEARQKAASARFEFGEKG